MREKYEQLIDQKEVTAWSVIYYTFKIYLMKEYNPYKLNIENEYNILNKEINALKKLVDEGNQIYPLVYLLIYREFLLDMVLIFILIVLNLLFDVYLLIHGIKKMLLIICKFVITYYFFYNFVLLY